MNNTAKSIAVIGAGVMGLMSARILSRAEHHITIYDPAGFPADNASFIAGGMLAPYSEIEHMDMAWVNAGLSGIEIWKDIDGDIDFHQNGSLLVAHDQDAYILERFKSHIPSNKQKCCAANSIEPTLNTNFKDALYLEDEAHLDPQKTMHVLCKALNKPNVKFVQNTSTPETLSNKHDWIIDCRGMGSDDPDIRGVKGEIAVVRNTEFELNRPIRLMHPRYPLYIVPRADNVFMIGATIIEAADKTVNVRSGLELLSALYTLDSSFGEAEIMSMQAGVRPSYPNNLPRIKVHDNIISANGLFRHGYLLSPVMAECIEHYIAGKTHKFWTLMTGETAHGYNDKRHEKNIRRTA